VNGTTCKECGARLLLFREEEQEEEQEKGNFLGITCRATSRIHAPSLTPTVSLLEVGFVAVPLF